jgi:hypothetical protein
MLSEAVNKIAAVFSFYFSAEERERAVDAAMGEEEEE